MTPNEYDLEARKLKALIRIADEQERISELLVKIVDLLSAIAPSPPRSLFEGTEGESLMIDLEERAREIADFAAWTDKTLLRRLCGFITEQGHAETCIEWLERRAGEEDDRR